QPLAAHSSHTDTHTDTHRGRGTVIVLDTGVPLQVGLVLYRIHSGLRIPGLYGRAHALRECVSVSVLLLFVSRSSTKRADPGSQ
ncbi:hypothetical protein LSH36_677g03001, partial [Paralvinella palmiformis]